jgi:transcriptional regulator with XRE-family HTH domain
LRRYVWRMKFNGQALRDIREEKQPKLSIDRLAFLAGVSPDTVQRAETGQNIPSAENLAKIANALGVPLEELFTENGEEAA